MKMDSQHRLMIPMDIRELFGIEKGEEYCFNFESDNLFSLEKECKGKVIAKVKVDHKGRFFVPRYVIEFFDSKKLILYYKKQKIWISIFQENT